MIAVATPGKPSVVIDRIAYTPYGESTRTLRSDVNGDGVVNKDDYDGVIQPLKGTLIGDPEYVVEADLDRDGKITSDDYDVCIADDGQKSGGGVGEASLFSAGVRNSVGYCGYIHNEDTGLYTVRYRTYSATLGRWLTRDPLGYVDSANVYQYVMGSPIDLIDPEGLDGSTPEDWRLDRTDHGGPHFQRGECRYRVDDLTPIPHKGKIPPALSDADKLDILQKHWKKLLKEHPNSKLTQEILDSLRSSLGDAAFEELKKGGKKCLSQKQVKEIVQSLAKRLEKEAAEEAAKLAGKSASTLLKAGKGIGMSVGKKVVPIILIAMFAQDCYAQGPVYATVNTVVPVDLLNDVMKSAADRYSQWLDEGQYNVMVQRFINSGMSESEAREAAKDHVRSCPCPTQK